MEGDVFGEEGGGVGGEGEVGGLEGVGWGRRWSFEIGVGVWGDGGRVGLGVM